MKLVGSAFMIVALFCLYYCFQFIKDYFFLKTNGLKTQGKVIEVKQEKSLSKPYFFYFPVVEYNDEKGNVYRLKSDTGKPERSKLEIGLKVDVIYLKDRPEKFSIDQDNNLIFPIVLFCMALLFGIFGYSSLF